MSYLRLPKPFTPQEIEALWAASSDRPDVKAAMVFLLETGMRSAEALSISRAEVESWPPVERRPLFTFRRPEPRAVFCRIVGKGDKERVVVVSQAAQEAARELLRYPPSAGRNGLMVPWGARSLRWVIQQVGCRAGVVAHPHRFRHTAIQTWVDAGVPIQTVADMAGHSSIDTTRLYFSASQTARLEALEATARFRAR